VDSDTGDMDRSVKKKAKRKKGHNQGPCIRVISVTRQGDGGFKVECHLDTVHQKTVTFEFLTSDLSTDEMSTAFVRRFASLKLYVDRVGQFLWVF